MTGRPRSLSCRSESAERQSGNSRQVCFRSDDFAAFPALPERASAASSGIDAEVLGVRSRRRSSSPMGEIRPAPAMRLVGPLAARSPGLRLAFDHEIERHCSADEILQGRLIDLVAFVDVNGAPDTPVEAGVE